jgi:hypothetical protein
MVSKCLYKLVNEPLIDCEKVLRERLQDNFHDKCALLHIVARLSPSPPTLSRPQQNARQLRCLDFARWVHRRGLYAGDLTVPLLQYSSYLLNVRHHHPRLYGASKWSAPLGTPGITVLRSSDEDATVPSMNASFC